VPTLVTTNDGVTDSCSAVVLPAVPAPTTTAVDSVLPLGAEADRVEPAGALGAVAGAAAKSAA
jgi:hypothetical protein